MIKGHSMPLISIMLSIPAYHTEDQFPDRENVYFSKFPTCGTKKGLSYLLYTVCKYHKPLYPLASSLATHRA